MVFTNTFSWSKSTQEAFNECRRKYYYDKYGFWGAWESGATEEVKQIDMLKNMKPLEMWVGEVIHDQIRQILIKTRSKMSINPDALVESMVNKMKADMRSSEAGLYKVKRKSCSLLCHEYHLLVEERDIALIFDRATRCILNFLQSDFYAHVRAIPISEYRFIDDDKPQSFMLDGTQIYLKIDFARLRTDEVHIYDWKTGNNSDEEKEKLQLNVYALYCLDKWKFPLDKIKVVLFNLNRMSEPEERIVNEADIESCKTIIKNGISAMKSLLVDPVNNIAAIENYPLNETRCLAGNQVCKYKKICYPNGGDSVFASDLFES
ncbi:MAG: PD-(D/E)XK nuclease family protein [archaeon]